MLLTRDWTITDDLMTLSPLERAAVIAIDYKCPTVDAPFSWSYNLFFLKVIAKSMAPLSNTTPACMLRFYFLFGEPNYPENKTRQVVWVVFLVLKFEVK